MVSTNFWRDRNAKNTRRGLATDEEINGALADYVRASEFKPTEERALTAVTMVKHLWAICFWGSWIFFIGLGSLLLLILHLHATL